MAPEDREVVEDAGEDLDFGDIFDEQEVAADQPEQPAQRTEVDREVLDLFRLGGWFRRVPTIDPETHRKPNRGSARPADISAIVWAGLGQLAQVREIECRRLKVPAGRLR